MPFLYHPVPVSMQRQMHAASPPPAAIVSGVEPRSRVDRSPPQVGSYKLVYEDDFSHSKVCQDPAIRCDWYNSGLWYEPPHGVIQLTQNGALELRWAAGQGSGRTDVSTSPKSLTGFRAWTFGYFEVRMAFDPVVGSWPAIWMISPRDGPGNETDNELYPELDAFEWQSNTPSQFLGTIHVWKNSAFLASNGITPAPDVKYSQFNTYGVLWTPTTISWYLNDHLLGSVDITKEPYNNAFAGQQPLFLVLSQQAGCNWKYACEGQVSPLHIEVEWVRVYQQPSTK